MQAATRVANETLAQHRRYLFGYALARLREADAAEELVQDTLLAALRRKQFQRQVVAAPAHGDSQAQDNRLETPSSAQSGRRGARSATMTATMRNRSMRFAIRTKPGWVERRRR
jgi:hypothetical protein